MVKLFLLAVCLQALSSITECLVKRQSVIDTGTHIEICTQAPLEVGIVLDSSSSINQGDFLTAKAFLEHYLQHFDLGSGAEGVRVSIITYGKGIYPEDGFNLTTYHSKKDVLEAVRRIPHRVGLFTDTGLAIEHMHKVQLADDVVRPWAQKISVVITDGNSQKWRVTKQAAEAARKDDIIIFAIGVGRGARDEELLNIAGDQSRVTKVENYDQLNSINDVLATKTCIKKEKPTTTSQPQTQRELGADATAWTTSFIVNTISGENMDVGFRVPDVTCFKGMQSNTSRQEFLLWGRVPALCDTKTDDGGWVIIQRRTTGDVDFYKPWTEYKIGFGIPATDFWIGLDVIHNLTSQGYNELRFDLQYNGQNYFAHYSNFTVADELSKYQLSVGEYNGTAGDSFTYHSGMMFTTYDSDNDASPGSCESYLPGAWWFRYCHFSHLNGVWGANDVSGISWYNLTLYTTTLSSTEMKVRQV